MGESPLPMVLRAMQALYGMDGAEQQREANEFLNSFVASDAAWGVGFHLLQDETLNLPSEALYFAATMLHTKVRKEWIQLSVEHKTGMMLSLQMLMQVLRDGKRPSFHYGPLARKLCAIYAVVMISSPDDCKALLSHLLESCSTTGDAKDLAFFLTFSRCVCEEMNDAALAFAAKDTMEMHLFSLSGDVVALIGKIVLTREDQNSAVSALHGEALACLNVWVRRAGLSLASLYVKNEALFLALLDALQSKSRHLQVCAEILMKLITVASYPTSGQLETTLLVVAQGLLQTQAACESALVAEEEEICHALTDVISTFCETFVDWILQGQHPEEAVALGKLMLFLGAQSRRQIASLTLEFWMIVQEEPVASRLYFYQHDAFVHLFDVMLQQCSFPLGNVDDMDELELDDLRAFRSGFQGVSDVLIAIFSLLKDKYVARLLPILLSAACNEWQKVEVALFAIATVTEELKQKLIAASGNSSQQSELENMISQVFEAILSSKTTSHPLVMTTASRLLGQFANWINSRALQARAFDTVGAVLQYLTHALGVQASRTNAARSFMQIAVTCTPCLAEIQPTYLVASVACFGPSISGQGMPISDRLVIVEGLVRAAAVSPNCLMILHTVLQDSLARLDHVLEEEEALGANAVPTLVCNELQVLGKVMRFLDAPESVAGGQDVTKWAVEQFWSHLEPLTPRFEGNEEVMSALFDLFGWCLQSLRHEMAPQLGGIARLIVKVFQEHHFVAPLECAAVAVDVFGKNADVAIVDSFRDLLGALSRSAFQFFTLHSITESPDVLRSFFELAYRFLLFCPAAVLTGEDFAVLIELSLACLGNPDRASTTAIVMFLTFLLNESSNKLTRFESVIHAIVLEVGQTEKWLDRLIHALAAQSPSVLYDSLGKLLYVLLSRFNEYERVRATLEECLKRDALELKELKPNDRRQVLHLWLALAAEPSRYSERRFRGVCSDFAKVCRKELTVDTLYSIELPN